MATGATFFHRLRSLNESLEPGKPRLSWFGFDIDVLSGGGYVDARDLLGPYESQPLAREILGRLERVPGESMAEERARLVDALAFLDSENAKMERMLGVTKAADLKRTLRCMADGFLFLDTASDMRRWVEALATREQTMYRQMDETLEALPHDEKIILLGHALHLSKDSDTILLMSPSGQPYPMWLSIGTYLARKQPGQVYSVWMQYDHGRHGNMVLESGFNDVPSQPERIEYLLAKAGPAFVLPLHTGDEGESYLKQMRTFVQNGSVANGVLVNQADAIFFVEEVTAIQGP